MPERGQFLGGEQEGGCEKPSRQGIEVSDRRDGERAQPRRGEQAEGTGHLPQFQPGGWLGIRRAGDTEPDLRLEQVFPQLVARGLEVLLPLVRAAG